MSNHPTETRPGEDYASEPARQNLRLAVLEAVRANAYEALYWLRDSALPIREVLRADGLLT